jgi:hypothetical protein
MKRKFLVVSIFFVFHVSADTSKAQIYQQKNSSCTVKSLAGEYPHFSVYKNDGPVFTPKSDGVHGVAFSKSGTHVALGSSEIGQIDVKGKFYQLAIVNCRNGEVSGYNIDVKDVTSAWPKAWRAEDKMLDVSYSTQEAGNKVFSLDFEKIKLP